MDAFIHCIESLNGSYRNSIGDAYSRETLRLCNEVFMSSDMKSDLNREKLMVASYLGGCAIASSYVGIVHSHPVGSAEPSLTDLNNFFGLVSMIVKSPYDNDDIFAWDSDGNKILLDIV